MFSLVNGYFVLLKNLLQQKRFLNRTLERDLKHIKNDHDQSLTKTDFKKLTSYYALGVPAVLGTVLCVLRGTPINNRERLCMSYLGGISGLLDDLFDDPNKEAGPIKNWVLQPQDRVPYSSHEKLLLQLYIKGLSFSDMPNCIKTQALKVYHAQEKSITQNQSDLTASQIDEIMYAKGGTSFIYYRLCLHHPMEEAEEKLLFHLGGLMQLGNDIFDVWEDFRDGISTAATRCRDIKELRTYFNVQLEKTFLLARATSFDKKNIKKFLNLTVLALARVFVCLDQFENLQQTTHNTFILENYPRNLLICDMQKVSNQWRAMKYSYSLVGYI